MKRLFCFGIIIATMLAAPAIRAQPYANDWLKIADGGGTSTGGVYSTCGGRARCPQRPRMWWVRVRDIGANDKGGWSDPAVKTVAWGKV